MSKTMDDDDPIKTGPASQAYLDNWERIFGEKENEPRPVFVIIPTHMDNTGDRCRNGGRQVEIAALSDHDCCYLCNDLAIRLP